MWQLRYLRTDEEGLANADEDAPDEDAPEDAPDDDDAAGDGEAPDDDEAVRVLVCMAGARRLSMRPFLMQSSKVVSLRRHSCLRCS